MNFPYSVFLLGRDETRYKVMVESKRILKLKSLITTSLTKGVVSVSGLEWEGRVTHKALNQLVNLKCAYYIIKCKHKQLSKERISLLIGEITLAEQFSLPDHHPSLTLPPASTPLLLTHPSASLHNF